MTRNLELTSLLAGFCAARESGLLTPDGFGGSDGFGQRPTSDAMARPPEPRCVALVATCKPVKVLCALACESSACRLTTTKPSIRRKGWLMCASIPN